MKFQSKMNSVVFAGLLTGSWACGELPTEQVNTSLVGVWNLVGYEDGDRVAAPSGTWVFFDDGFMALDLELDFPESPTAFIAATGFFEQVRDGVLLEVRQFETAWALEFHNDLATFRKTSPTPADDTIVLRRF